MRTCRKCGSPLPLQTGKGRRRTLCEVCSPPRRRPSTATLVTPRPRPRGTEDQGLTVEQATENALREAGVLDSPLSRLALILSRRIDTEQEPGSALAQLVRQHRETLASALLGVEPAEDLDDPVTLARRRRAERTQGFGTV